MPLTKLRKISKSTDPELEISKGLFLMELILLKLELLISELMF